MNSVMLAWFKTAFELMLSKVFEVKYPRLSAREMFPVSQEGGKGIDSVSYEVWDDVGIAEFIAAYANGIPRAEVGGRKYTVPVHRMALSFGMTIDEIEKSQVTGLPLSNKKAMAVRKGHEYTINRTAFYGNDQLGLMGLFSHPSITRIDDAPDLASMTVDQILAFFKTGVTEIQNLTNGIESPDTIRIPDKIYTELAFKQMGTTAPGQTVLEWLREKLGQIGVTTLATYQEGNDVATLYGATPASHTHVVTYYENSSDCLELSIPEDINFREPQIKDLETSSVGTAKTGGLIVYKPLAIATQTIIFDETA